MSKNERLKHLERAFTAAPPELSATVEEAFERGEQAMKKRYKFMTAIGIAAALAVLFAALALATGQLLRPRVDRVVASQGSGEGPGAASETGEERDATAPPTAMPEQAETMELSEAALPQPEEASSEMDAEEPACYATLDGRYFHLDEHCSGMMNAMPCALSTVQLMGKQPCPVCVGGDALPELYYYATPAGQYYHIFENCSGMRGANRYVLESVWELGKQPCPVCLADPVYCWATPWGTYYHSERECMGMRNARVYTEVWARRLGKRPCPVCNGGEAEEAVTGMKGVAAENAAAPGTLTLCYVTAEGEYYHFDRECSGMLNARFDSVSDALARGKRPCPVCAGDGAEGEEVRMTAELAWTLVQDRGAAAGEARDSWIYLSSEGSGAWVFYAVGFDSMEATFIGEAWYVGERFVCLGWPHALSDWLFITPRPESPEAEPEAGEAYARSGWHVAGGPELFAGIVRTNEGNEVHVWRLGEEGAPVELDAGDKLRSLAVVGGQLVGLTDGDSVDRCFLQVSGGRLEQVAGVPVAVDAAGALPGVGEVMEELRRNGFSITGCLYRAMNTGAETVTVNMERDGEPNHAYLFRENGDEAFETDRGWMDEVDCFTGEGSAQPDAGLPTVVSRGLSQGMRL